MFGGRERFAAKPHHCGSPPALPFPLDPPRLSDRRFPRVSTPLLFSSPFPRARKQLEGAVVPVFAGDGGGGVGGDWMLFGRSWALDGLAKMTPGYARSA